MVRAKDIAIVVLIALVIYFVATKDWRTEPNVDWQNANISIAIIPFDVSDTGNKQVTFLRVALHDALLLNLQQADGLAAHMIPVDPVVEIDMSQESLAASLGSDVIIDAVIEGAIRLDGDKVVATFHLFDINSNHLWAGEYSYSPEDVNLIAASTAREVQSAFN